MQTKLPPRLYADLVGRPFVADARGPCAYDCLGLAIELQRRQGRDVPDFASTPEEFARQIGVGVLGPCRLVAQAEAGCVVLLRMMHDERHIGTMLDPWRMLHTMRDLGGAAIERVNATVWQRRVLGFYVPVQANGVGA